MTNVTRQDLEACARLLGYDDMPNSNTHRDIYNLLELARAAKLRIDYANKTVAWNEGDRMRWICWPTDGTEAECIIKASASVQLEREKHNERK